MKNLEIWIRSIIFKIVFYVWSAFIFIVFLPTVFLPLKYRYILPILWNKSVMFLLRVICAVQLKVEGLDNLPKKNGYIVAAKHQSAMETMLFHMNVPFTFFVLKRDLMLIPIAGFYAIATKCVPIDRKGGAKTLRMMLEKVQKRIQQGMNLVIFPEGTRTKPGTKKPYAPGVALLYEQCNVPVVPVALDTGYCWPKNSFRKYPGTVTVRFLKPIEPGLHKRAFLSELYDRIEEEQDKLDAGRC